MSSAPGHKAPPTKSKKEKDRERREKQSQTLERLKTVVRRLPPNLPEEIFWQSVQPWVTDETVTWKFYYAGKLRKRLNKENIPSRAYIAFKSDEVLAEFSRAYDGHVFRDKGGNESQAVVEYAPYQKIPSDRKKPDARNATIETDESYISFLESLNAPVNREPVLIETLMASTRPPTPPKTTPLLEALKAEKSAQKDKEAILRNHAHYKDQVMIVHRKEDGKRKPAPRPKSAESPVSTKKPGKKEKGPIQIAVPPSKAQQQQQQGSQPKNTAGTSGGNTNATAVAQANSKPPKPPKQPRAHRQTQQANNAHAPQNNANTPAAAQAAAPAPPPATTNEAESTTPNTPTTPSSRRGRPILGLGGRHFEAALSGVGATIPPGERKSRREKQREREASASVNGNGTPVATVPADGPNGSDPRSHEKPARESPTTPKKERKRKDGGGDRVPTLLQRGEGAPAISILQRDMPRIDDVPAGQSDGPMTEATTNHAPPARGGGPRRGRGRGGRGSAANRGG